MPPQPGMFALPYASTHKARTDIIQPDNMPMSISYSNMQPPQGPNPHYHNTHPTAGPSRVQGTSLFLANLNVRTHLANKDDPKREKKRKDISGKVGKEMLDRRDEYVPLRPLFSSPLNFVLEDDTSLKISLHSTAPQCSSLLVQKLILFIISVYIPFLSSAPPCSPSTGSKKSIAWNQYRPPTRRSVKESRRNGARAVIVYENGSSKV
jgi:hypothetical protein